LDMLLPDRPMRRYSYYLNFMHAVQIKRSNSSQVFFNAENCFPEAEGYRGTGVRCVNLSLNLTAYLIRQQVLIIGCCGSDLPVLTT
jgi:hypothetical protein